MNITIELQNLSIGYDKIPLISDLNYKFTNKIYGLLGESGVGKTTLLRTIAGLNKPLSGKIIRDVNTDIYMMHQQYTSFDWLTCLDNILITAKVNHIRIDDELKDKAKLEFKKLNENYNINNDFDIYNELSALNPLKK